MSRNPNTRLQRRDERAARHPGNVQRVRRDRGSSTAVRGPGRGIPITAVLIAAGVIAIVAMLVYAVTQSDNVNTGPSASQKAQDDADPNIPGVYYAPHPGPDGQLNTQDDRLHYAPGTLIPICTQAQLDEKNYVNPLCYTSNPPTSGPHSNTPMPFKVLDNPAPKENLLHNMEHGGVVVWYNTTDQAAIDELKSITNDNIDRRRFVVMTQYTEMEPETVAVTSWTRLDKFPVGDLTKKRVQDFIDENHKRFNPEGF
ncbi:MAG TPA: DUF3105 domain-containing protein [Dehalococcoidia bacterium]|nr:DUF3105 domain-containing protein [Dehalococcoidia bacterium]